MFPNMKTPVDSLLKNPFFNRSREEMEQVVLEGKPRPNLKDLKQRKRKINPGRPSMDERDPRYVYFDASSYDQIEWLTGCDMRQGLFCWPCLLFRNPKDDWNSNNGFRELQYFQEHVENHEKSAEHLQAVLDMRIFTDTIQVEPPVSPIQEKELITRNREIARRVIDVICFLASQQRCPRPGTRDTNSLIIEDCLENLQFLRDYDLLQTSLIDDATDMLQITPTIVTDMADAITNVMKTAMVKEMHQSSFVSMILSEHYGDPSKCQFSTVLRYLKRGEVCERFFGFTNTTEVKCPKTVVNHMNKIVNECQIARRLAAYSIDGSLLQMVGYMNETKIQLQVRYPYIFHLPCHYHKLDFVLQKSVVYMKNCDCFFNGMEAIASYFQKGSRLYQLFEDFTGPRAEQVDLDISKSSNYAEFFRNFKTSRCYLLDFCDFIINNTQKVSGSDMVKVQGIRTFLSEFMATFLVDLFAKLFGLTAPLAEACSTHIPGRLFDKALIESVLKSLDDLEFRREAYDNLWNETFRDFQELKRYRNSDGKFSASKKQPIHKLYIDLIRCIRGQIRFRFENARKMSFFHVLNFEKLGYYLKFEYVQTLTTTYGQKFLYDELEKEIKLLNRNKPVPKNEPVHGLLKFLTHSQQFSPLFPNIYKLCELVMSLPCMPPSGDRSTTKLEQIHSWSYAPGKHEVAGDISILCVEINFLQELREDPTFYNEVIQTFQEKNKTLDLF